MRQSSVSRCPHRKDRPRPPFSENCAGPRIEFRFAVPHRPAAGRAEHIPDAEIHWPSVDGSPYADQVWAIEVELTPKPVARTTRIIAGLLSPMTYGQVIYLTAPKARPVVVRAAGSLPPGDQARVVVRDLPAAAFTGSAMLVGNLILARMFKRRWI